MHHTKLDDLGLGRLARLVRPLPARNIGPVGTVLVRVVLTSDLFIEKFRQGGAADPLQSRDVLDHIHGQCEAIDFILDRQLQRSVDIAVFLVTMDVEVVMICAAVS